MTRAIWNDTVVAESERCVVVEGNSYFPPEAVDKTFLQASATHTICGWKGTASYYDVTANGVAAKDAAWYYPDPKSEASAIKGYIAFWKGVRIEV